MEKKRIKDLIKKIFSGEWGISVDEFDFNKVNKPMERVSVIRTANFKNDGKIDYSNTVERVIDKKNVDAKQLKNGDIIIEKSGGSPNQPVGRVVFFDLETRETLLSNNFTAVIRVKENINSKFLFYNLFFLHHSGKTQKYQNKTVGILNLKLSDFLKETVLLPDLETQNRIVAILDRAHNLIQKRQQSCELFDHLIKSVFLEMFENQLMDKASQMKLGDYIKKGPQNGIYKHDEYYGEGTKIVRIDSFYDGILNSDSYKLIKLTVDEEEKYLLKQNDILINRVNSKKFLGKSAIVTSTAEKAVFESNIMRFSVYEERLDPFFLIFSLQLSYIKKQILQKSKDAINQSSINQTDVKSLLIPIPNIESQKVFSKIYRVVLSIKERLGSNIIELDNFFQSLLQKSFVGELEFEKEKILEDILSKLKIEELLSDLKLVKSLLDKLQNQNFKTGNNYKLAQNLLFQLLDNEKSGVFQQCDVETENIEIKHEAS